MNADKTFLAERESLLLRGGFFVIGRPGAAAVVAVSEGFVSRIW